MNPYNGGVEKHRWYLYCSATAQTKAVAGGQLPAASHKAQRVSMAGDGNILGVHVRVLVSLGKLDDLNAVAGETGDAIYGVNNGVGEEEDVRATAGRILDDLGLVLGRQHGTVLDLLSKRQKVVHLLGHHARDIEHHDVGKPGRTRSDDVGHVGDLAGQGDAVVVPFKGIDKNRLASAAKRVDVEVDVALVCRPGDHVDDGALPTIRLKVVQRRHLGVQGAHPLDVVEVKQRALREGVADGLDVGGLLAHLGDVIQVGTLAGAEVGELAKEVGAVNTRILLGDVLDTLVARTLAELPVGGAEGRIGKSLDGSQALVGRELDVTLKVRAVGLMAALHLVNGADDA